MWSRSWSAAIALEPGLVEDSPSREGTKSSSSIFAQVAVRQDGSPTASRPPDRTRAPGQSELGLTASHFALNEARAHDSLITRLPPLHSEASSRSAMWRLQRGIQLPGRPPRANSGQLSTGRPSAVVAAGERSLLLVCPRNRLPVPIRSNERAFVGGQWTIPRGHGTSNLSSGRPERRRSILLSRAYFTCRGCSPQSSPVIQSDPYKWGDTA